MRSAQHANLGAHRSWPQAPKNVAGFLVRRKRKKNEALFAFGREKIEPPFLSRLKQLNIGLGPFSFRP